VGPTTLLATSERSQAFGNGKQNKNALEIAKKGGELYDKLSAFVEDLVKVGTRMDDAKKAMKRQ
jgi:DNA recombination protein RmuC